MVGGKKRKNDEKRFKMPKMATRIKLLKENVYGKREALLRDRGYFLKRRTVI